jgi:hypothetical protein
VSFTVYWDNYDNKLASIIVAEAYSPPTLTMAMTYLVWFRVVIYVRKKDMVENRDSDAKARTAAMIRRIR